MGDTDKQYFEWFYRKIQAEGVPAVWTGSERHCGNYPALVAGMPGLYIFDAKEYCSMFYPAAWRYRYGVYAAVENITVEASPVAEGRVNAVCFPNEHVYEPSKYHEGLEVCKWCGSARQAVESIKEEA